MTLKYPKDLKRNKNLTELSTANANLCCLLSCIKRDYEKKGNNNELILDAMKMQRQLLEMELELKKELRELKETQNK
tara:strand:+ start:15 stop:245 length:231 start_codon:yes stop_codon:yes gene_type:complete